MLKVSELTGAQLDYWVARAEGWELEHDEKGQIWYTLFDQGNGFECPTGEIPTGGAIFNWRPSTDWSEGGPIIEREKICIDAGDGLYPERKAWAAWMAGNAPVHADAELTGPTFLVAAMRAYVTSKFGYEVPECGN